MLESLGYYKVSVNMARFEVTSRAALIWSSHRLLATAVPGAQCPGTIEYLTSCRHIVLMETAFTVAAWPSWRYMPYGLMTSNGQHAKYLGRRAYIKEQHWDVAASYCATGTCILDAASLGTSWTTAFMTFAFATWSRELAVRLLWLRTVCNAISLLVVSVRSALLRVSESS